MKRFVGILLVLIFVMGAATCRTVQWPSPETGAGPQAHAPTGSETGSAAPEADASIGSDIDAPQTEDETGGDSIYAPDDEPHNEPQYEPDSEPQEEPEDDAQEADAEPLPVFGFIDAHADTITRALLPHNNAGLLRNNLHVDFERLSQFGSPVQVFAIWLADRYVDNAFERANYLIDFFEREVERHSDMIEIALTLEDIERIARDGKIVAILSIEGAEPLEGKIENVDHFYNRGVRIMSLTWNRENELGFGQGTGSNEGLKPFGMEVVRRMDELGIIMDVSHINEAGFWDIHRLSTRPYMASHSNSFTVRPHNRNLTDDQIMAITERGGIIGLALYPLILSPNRNVTMRDIMAHIDHFINLGAGGNLGLGGDLDGFRDLPAGLANCVLSYKILADEIAAAFDEETSQRIMSGNFYDFFVRYFGR